MTLLLTRPSPNTWLKIEARFCSWREEEHDYILHISFSDSHSFSKNRCVIQTKLVTIASPYLKGKIPFSMYLMKGSFHVEKNMKKRKKDHVPARGKHVSEVLTLWQTPFASSSVETHEKLLCEQLTGSTKYP